MKNFSFNLCYTLFFTVTILHMQQLCSQSRYTLAPTDDTEDTKAEGEDDGDDVIGSKLRAPSLFTATRTRSSTAYTPLTASEEINLNNFMQEADGTEGDLQTVPLESGFTAFQCAARGLGEELKMLLKSNPKLIHSRNSNAETLAIVAAKHGQKHILNIVLAYDIDLYATDRSMMTALMHAAAWVGIYSGSWAHPCSEDHREDLVSALLRKLNETPKSRLNQQDNRGQTALIHAARHNNQEAVKELLAAGASADIKDFAGQTALAHAKKEGHKEIVALLKGKTGCRCCVM